MRTWVRFGRKELAQWRSPLGWLAVVAGEEGLEEVSFHDDPGAIRARLQERYPDLVEGGGAAVEAIVQIREFFEGRRRTFSLRINVDFLPPFTARVLRVLSTVPFGRTLSYGELAALAGSPGAARAVGRSMAINPFPIVIPCHRVIGSTGHMTGYSGGEGLRTKEWLLEFERGLKRSGML